MCGIVGYIDRSLEHPDKTLTAMMHRIAHRGPDNSGTWFDREHGVGLGHLRLSIVDLSPLGHQPMLSHSGRYAMVFNGEVYNFQSLMAELKSLGHTFRGHSDTEIMLAAFEAWGVDAAIRRFNGMFAFALWDRHEAVLTLVRDRLGVKPLYYGWSGQGFLFASELKAFYPHPGFRAEINRDGVGLVLQYGYIPVPHTIFRGMYKLPPGTSVRLSRADLEAGPELFWPHADGDATRLHPVRYWSVLEAYHRAHVHPFRESPAAAVDELERLLTDAVGCRMIADVPLGAFLSGGVDSSVVVALMQKQSSQPVKTFSIGFHESEYNEATHAREVAKHLGTDHTELYVTPQEAQAVIPRLPTIYDEPFADSSQIPTFLVSKLARQRVTVSLSGDGGDELFGGYNRYLWAEGVWKLMKWAPRPVRIVLGEALSLLSPTQWNQLFKMATALLPASLQMRSPGEKVYKLIELLGVRTGQQLYQRVMSHWQRVEALVPGFVVPRVAMNTGMGQLPGGDLVDAMMYLDMVSYLPDDILTKVDRATMAVALEGREPLLDYRLLEFAWRLPQSLKLRAGKGKWILRQVLYRHVPEALIDRPKMGFAVPVDAWLRGPLREWAESLLSDSALRSHGFLLPEPVRAKWAEHLSGARDWQYYLWNVLMLQAWYDEYRKEQRYDA